MGGNTSKVPILDKKVYDKIDNGLRIGICEMQGWRRTMEDASLVVSNFGPENLSLFGIFDGHGGSIISKFVASNFLNVFTSSPSFKNKNYEQALIESYIKFDEFLKNKDVNELLLRRNKIKEFNKKRNEENTKQIFQTKDNIFPLILKYEGNSVEIEDNTNNNNNDYNNRSTSAEGDEIDECSSQLSDASEIKDIVRNNFLVAKEMGTTANVLFLTKNHLYISNVGDSLSVIYKNGKAIKLNQEHKTTLISEYERIRKSGAHIYNNRIEGKLNLSRAIGDLAFKATPNLKFYEQSVTAFPERSKMKRANDIQFIIMGCDGIWDCVEEQGLCEEIENNIKKDPNKKLSTILSEIFDKIVSKTNNIPIGTDNMSCIIIQFMPQINIKSTSNNQILPQED